MPPPATVPDAVIFAGRYEVRGVLGGGAMGTVYRAVDRALDEPVAIKLLKKELTISPEIVERFRREVKLARRVTHRNIARVFDIGAHGPQPFLTMELVEGASLGEIMARQGSLPPDEVVRVALSLCDGLTAAHTAGVIHRDLKPENVVMEHGGRVVITDFGVACALAERDLPYGASGAFVGSPAYMAPEQVEGTAHIDPRADIYALGVMLFELLTGELPWGGGSILAMAAARLIRPPPDPRTIDAAVPPAIAEIVVRCLARSRDERWATAADVAVALRAVGTAGIEAQLPQTHRTRRAGGKTLAVMPILNAIGAEADYFCRGVVAELADALGSLPDVQVRHGLVSGDLGRDPRESARMLGVQTVVSGTLERPLHDAGIRLTLELVTVEDGLGLWSQRFDGRSLLDLARAARTSASAIGRVLDANAGRLTTDTIDDPRAHDLHMRGRFAYQRAWFEANEQAVLLLEEALELSPRSPMIAGTLALALARAYGIGGAGEDAKVRARSLAEAALAQAPQLADPRVALAALHAYDAEGVAAAAELRRALDTSPDAVEALEWMGRLCVEVGEVDRGLAYFDRSLALEPSTVGTTLEAALVRAGAGDWDRIRVDLARPPREAPDRALYFVYRARLAMWGEGNGTLRLHYGDLDDMPASARAAVETMFRIVSTRTIDEEAAAVIDRMLPTTDLPGAHAAGAPRRAVYNAQLRAEIFAHVGRNDDALASVRDADAAGMFDLVWLERSPALEPLRADPEMPRIVRNVAARAARVRAALG